MQRADIVVGLMLLNTCTNIGFNAFVYYDACQFEY